MKEIAVYCAKSWLISTWRTTGARPLTSPPLFAESLDLSWLRAKIVYIRLHGIDGQPYLYSDPGWHTALTAEQVAQADFEGCHIFLEGCQGDELMQAFMQAGAESVVGSRNSTWGRRYFLGPSSTVGSKWLKEMRGGKEPDQALSEAIQLVPEPYSQGWLVEKRKTL